MRWPLRYQILLPLVVVMLGTLIGVSVLNAWLSTQRTKKQIEDRLASVAETLAKSNFPFTVAVLEQMSGLSSAEYVVTSKTGEIQKKSDPSISDLPENATPQDWRHLSLDRTFETGGKKYFYTVVELDRPGAGRVLLHIFYPEQVWRDAQNEAVFPPLVLGTVALVLLMLVAVIIATGVTRPIARLRGQVEQIAHGEFQPMEIPARDDEIRDLGVAVNRMAEMLARYEDNVRRNERLRSLGQLGGGIAHQMRNAATGCRIALDLHNQACPLHGENEDLEVATRQLSLMEKYLRRFLTLGRETNVDMQDLELTELVENVLSLVRPTAEHIGVGLEFRKPDEPVNTRGNSDGLEQLLINLTLNAIEAVSAEKGNVTVELSQNGEDEIRLTVTDSGPGPPSDIGEDIFDLLVSAKRDGAGLGLSIVRDIARQHNGKVYWERRNEQTSFIVDLPKVGQVCNLPV